MQISAVAICVQFWAAIMAVIAIINSNLISTLSFKNLCYKLEPVPLASPSVLSRLEELEKKFESLNASFRRVDSLEAEVVAMRKELRESMSRHDQLLSYVENQHLGNFWERKFCW